MPYSQTKLNEHFSWKEGKGICCGKKNINYIKCIEELGQFIPKGIDHKPWINPLGLPLESDCDIADIKGPKLLVNELKSCWDLFNDNKDGIKWCYDIDPSVKKKQNCDWSAGRLVLWTDANENDLTTTPSNQDPRYFHLRAVDKTMKFGFDIINKFHIHVDAAGKPVKCGKVRVGKDGKERRYRVPKKNKDRRRDPRAARAARPPKCPRTKRKKTAKDKDGNNVILIRDRPEPKSRRTNDAERSGYGSISLLHVLLALLLLFPINFLLMRYR